MTGNSNSSLLFRVLRREHVNPLPIWLMRQAGRYLPEYRALREHTGSFWKMCMTPKIAAEITLQPVKRFNFDAAIIFSDILVVPFALGQSVHFEEGIGPRLEVLRGVQTLDHNVEHWAAKLAPVYEALGSVRKTLAQDKALIGFAGGAWTLVSYMLEGKGSDDQAAAKSMLKADRGGFAKLINVLCDIIAWHLGKQLEAGAGCVQVFDSHAGSLTGQEFTDWIMKPTKQIVDKLRAKHPGAFVIGFPRGATPNDYERYAKETGVNAVSLDTAVDLNWAVPVLGDQVALQGNLDPAILVAGGTALDRAVDSIMAAARGAPFIFNLGHGVVPQTPIAHVERLVARVRAPA
jgi:uroporphyrinogen decarboxylase